MEESNKINSISKFLERISPIIEVAKNNIFFRGHSDEEFDIIPSIYRNSNHIENEDKIYKETIAKTPAQFNRKTTFDSLTLMQHYGVPTRILDLTTSALTALYFACISDHNRDGEILIFDIPEDKTCYSDSDKVTILANLAKCDKNFSYEYYFNKNLLDAINNKIEKEQIQVEANEKFLSQTNIKRYNEAIYTAITNSIELFFKDNSNNDNNIKNNLQYLLIKTFNSNINDIESIIEDNIIRPYLSQAFRTLDTNFVTHKVSLIILKYLKNVIYHLSIKYFNDSFFGKLIHNVRDDKPHFESIIDPNDIGQVFAVRPKLDNPRIVRQHGAFLIFGIKENSKNEIKPMPKVPDGWILSGRKSNNSFDNRIIIDAKSKQNILKELEMLGIDKSTIFPEIDKVAEYIKDKYN